MFITIISIMMSLVFDMDLKKMVLVFKLSECIPLDFTFSNPWHEAILCTMLEQTNIVYNQF